jgi:hypothetical protein
MSKKTLPDELRSVLAEHALDAPEAEASIAHVFSQTLHGDPLAAPRATRRLPHRALLTAAAAVLVLTLGGFGIVSATRQHGSSGAASSTADRASQPTPASATPRGLLPLSSRLAQRSGGATRGSIGDGQMPAAPPPPGLDCTGTPSGKAVLGGSAPLEVSAAVQPLYIYEFHCADAQGARSASTVLSYALISGVLQQRTVLVPVENDLYVDQLSTAKDSVILQGQRGPLGSYLHVELTSTDGGRNFQSRTEELAAPCAGTDLAVSMQRIDAITSGLSQTPGYTLLQLRNKGYYPCVVSGYLTVAGQPGAGTPTETLLGPAGGVTDPTYPIVQLVPGGMATAMIENGSSPGSCAPATSLSVTLPNGQAVGKVAVPALPLCAALLHPLVDNERGST